MSSSRLDNLFGDPEDDPLLQEDSFGDPSERQNGHPSNGRRDDAPPPASRTDDESGDRASDAAAESSEDDTPGSGFGEWTSDVWSSDDDSDSSDRAGSVQDESAEDESAQNEPAQNEPARAEDAETKGEAVDLPDLDDADPGATSDNPTASLTALLGRPRSGNADFEDDATIRQDERIVAVDAEAAARGHLDPLREALRDGWAIRRVVLQSDEDRLQFVLHVPNA